MSSVIWKPPPLPWWQSLRHGFRLEHLSIGTSIGALLRSILIEVKQKQQEHDNLMARLKSIDDKLILNRKELDATRQMIDCHVLVTFVLPRSKCFSAVCQSRYQWRGAQGGIRVGVIATKEEERKSRARDAALNAVQSPLLDIGIERATGIVWNITGGGDLTLFETRYHSSLLGTVRPLVCICLCVHCQFSSVTSPPRARITEPPLHKPTLRHSSRFSPFTNPYKNPLANRSSAPVASIAFASRIAGTRTI
ncbi:unnamed protein product [Camellia sinensis]